MALRRGGVSLARVGGGIPFLGALLKNESDVEVAAKRGLA